MPNRQEELTAMLRELRLPTMAISCAQMALKASKENLTHEGFLYELARLECEERAQRRIERHPMQSKLPELRKPSAPFNGIAFQPRSGCKLSACVTGNLFPTLTTSLLSASQASGKVILPQR
jgi:IstB-like ATP binding protein